MKIAVCITTRNRLKTFAKSWTNHVKHLPPEAKIFIVDDASDVPVRSSYRFPFRIGIPGAKNKCLELAYDWGAEHIFLFDDDTYPIDPNWWNPYVEHTEPHLMYIFTAFGNQSRGIKETYRSDKTVAYNHVMGCMLYLERRVLHVVGGFDPSFGVGMYEHTDLTNRIFNAGLTTHRVMDVPNSNKLIYSMDEHQEVETTFTDEERSRLMARNRRMKLQKSASREYKVFR